MKTGKPYVFSFKYSVDGDQLLSHQNRGSHCNG